MRRGVRHVTATVLLALAAALLLPAAAPAAVPGGDEIFTTTSMDFAEQSFSAVAHAADGSTFVAGRCLSARGDLDVLLVKLRADGSRAWRRVYDAPDHWNEVGLDVSVSKAGVVAVAGSAWLDASRQAGVLVQWTTRGSLVKGRRITSPVSGVADLDEVLTDRYGRTFVVGRCWNGSRSFDMVVAAYDRTGKRLWRHTVDGGANGPDFGSALAADGSGNIYAAGSMIKPATGSAAGIVKYTPAGRRLWSRAWDDGSDRAHVVNDIAVRGKVVGLAGAVMDGIHPNGLVARYDTSGRVRWGWVENGAFRDTQYAAIAVDSYAHLVVAGNEDFLSGSSADFLVSRYEPSGGPAVWDYRMPGSGASFDGTAGVAVSGEGEIFACGTVGNADGTRDGVVVHLHPVLATVWLARYSSGAEEYFADLALDGGGVTVAGSVSKYGLVQRFKLAPAP